MIIVKVTYTVNADYSARNQENIDQFMVSFRALGRDDFRYTAFKLNDNKTFVHLSVYKNEQIQQTLLDMPLFRSFQKQRDDSGLEQSPTIEVMRLAGSSHDLLA
jgi:hypothetical protein